MSPALLLFDIDGTLLTAPGVGRRAMNAAAAQVFGEHFTFDAFDFAGRLDTSVYAEAAAHHRLDAHHEHHDRFRDAYFAQLRTLLAADAGAVEVMPGVHELLTTLDRRAAQRGDCVLGVLTGNYAASARLKLLAGGIDPGRFTITAFAGDAETREGLVEVAMQRHRKLTGVPPAGERVIVIGDTPLDVACAKTHGCFAFAVATGRHTAPQLRAAGADVVVGDLRDAGPLLSLLEGQR